MSRIPGHCWTYITASYFLKIPLTPSLLASNRLICVNYSIFFPIFANWFLLFKRNFNLEREWTWKGWEWINGKNYAFDCKFRCFKSLQSRFRTLCMWKFSETCFYAHLIKGSNRNQTPCHWNSLVNSFHLPKNQNKFIFIFFYKSNNINKKNSFNL